LDAAARRPLSFYDGPSRVFVRSVEVAMDGNLLSRSPLAEMRSRRTVVAPVVSALPRILPLTMRAPITVRAPETDDGESGAGRATASSAPTQASGGEVLVARAATERPSRAPGADQPQKSVENIAADTPEAGARTPEDQQLSPAALDRLAKEVFDQVRRRLAIERERNGMSKRWNGI
jgi:hypothetical protein